ncbi:calcium-binding protein, partial [Leptolyngbya sp. FACHB-321]|uniref:calcium-binding protein n=1 Tax=Leptolyngbya sp. FACHB-321 TaxID=2692807 RepID=UPI001685B7A4
EGTAIGSESNPATRTGFNFISLCYLFANCAKSFAQSQSVIDTGGNTKFFATEGTLIIKAFGGAGTGVNPTADVIAEVDMLIFSGSALVAETLQLTQFGSDLELSFLGQTEGKVVLKNFAIEDLDNLQRSTGASVDIGNILFNGQTTIQDSFDVFNADWNYSQVFNRNTVTFLNDLNNTIQGFETSKDVINGQGGNDHINGLSGDDLLRGGDGNDRLYGGAGNDQLTGDAGVDRFLFASDRAFKLEDLGVDTITDFNRAEGDRIILSRTTFTNLKGTGRSLAADDFATLSTPANGASLAAGSTARIVFDRFSGDLYYNQNVASAGFGTGGKFATLSPLSSLSNSDISLNA